MILHRYWMDVIIFWSWLCLCPISRYSVGGEAVKRCDVAIDCR